MYLFLAYILPLTLYHTSTTFNDLASLRLLKTLFGKGENAGNQHFLLFPQCFLSYRRQTPSFEAHMNGRLQML